ncbi:MAG: translation initiation factor IF-3 [Vulcanibacillus sp.]
MQIFWGWKTISKELLINEEIRVREVRVVGPDGEQIGILPIKDALKLAEEKNFDLVNVAPQAKPPVCRIMDYGKFRYEQSKKEKEARKNQKIINTKEIRLSPTIDENDFQTKLRNAYKFINTGDKVKFSIRFKGRQIAHQSIGEKILDRIAKEIETIAVIESKPKLEGRSMIMIVSPK